MYLKSVMLKYGESSQGANIAASIIICPLILLAKGKEAEIKAGTEFKAYVENDVAVKVSKKGKLTRISYKKSRERTEKIDCRRKSKEWKRKRRKRKRKQVGQEKMNSTDVGIDDLVKKEESQ